ncbi:MAG: hypothetical protein HY690_09275 [Chloroflexi bacterium]|nr:hypothetical protein [Chloroflexota bacterium]
MNGIAARVADLANPRALLALALVAGVLAMQAGGGTLAFFTSSAANTGNQFTSGTLTVSSTLASGTGPGSTMIWTTSQGAGTTANTDCAKTTTTGSLIAAEPFAPGTYCVGKLTIQNTGSLDGDLRLRLVRTAGSTSAPDQDLNNLMQISLAELANGTVSCNTTAWTLSSGQFSSTAPTDYTFVTNAGNTAIRNTAMSAITATDTFTAASTSNAASSYITLLGTDDVDGTSTGTSAVFTASQTRYFCAAVLVPIGSLPGTNTTGDNTAQGGTDTYAFHAVIAQKASRS